MMTAEEFAESQNDLVASFARVHGRDKAVFLSRASNTTAIALAALVQLKQTPARDAARDQVLNNLEAICLRSSETAEEAEAAWNLCRHLLLRSADLLSQGAK